MPMNFRDDPPGQIRDPDETKNPRMWMAHALIYFGNVLIKGKFDKRIGLIPCCKKDIRLFQTSSVVSLDTIELWNFSVKPRAVGKTWLRTLTGLVPNWPSWSPGIIFIFLTTFSGDVKKVFQGRKTNKNKTSSPFQSSRGSRVQSNSSFLLDNTAKAHHWNQFHNLLNFFQTFIKYSTALQ